jgi:hypothetical protein
MWGMLKRHGVEILLKAGHPKTEVARLSGVSLRSVKRIAQERPIVHVDDKVERNKRQIGRPSTVQNFRKQVVGILHISIVRRLRHRRRHGQSEGRASGLLRSLEGRRPDIPILKEAKTEYAKRQTPVCWDGGFVRRSKLIAVRHDGYRPAMRFWLLAKMGVGFRSVGPSAWTSKLRTRTPQPRVRWSASR